MAHVPNPLEKVIGMATLAARSISRPLDVKTMRGRLSGLLWPHN
jgi:hypothetical protein